MLWSSRRKRACATLQALEGRRPTPSLTVQAAINFTAFPPFSFFPLQLNNLRIQGQQAILPWLPGAAGVCVSQLLPDEDLPQSARIWGGF